MGLRFNSRGRPPLDTGEALSLRKVVRLRPGEFTAIYQAAKADGKPMSAWIREQATKAATNTSEEPPPRR